MPAKLGGTTAIYTLSRQPSSNVTYNYLRNVGQQNSIYLDQGSSEFSVFYNVIESTYHQWILIPADGANDLVQDNWTRTDLASCPTIDQHSPGPGKTDAVTNSGECNYNGNLATPNYVNIIGAWPFDAQCVVGPTDPQCTTSPAGIESTYADIKTW